MSLCCTVSEMLSLISQNFKRSHDPEHFGSNPSRRHQYASVSLSTLTLKRLALPIPKQNSSATVQRTIMSAEILSNVDTSSIEFAKQVVEKVSNRVTDVTGIDSERRIQWRIEGYRRLGQLPGHQGRGHQRGEGKAKITQMCITKNVGAQSENLAQSIRNHRSVSGRIARNITVSDWETWRDDRRPPAYFDAAAERNDDDDDEEWTGGNGQLHQQWVHPQVIVVTHRSAAAHQL